MLVKKSERIEYRKGPVTSYEYPTGDKDINVALVKINGRYPVKGEARNRKAKELFFVVQGQGELTIEGTKFRLESGDVGRINPGERYSFEGELELVVPCSPAWTAEQCEVI